MTVLHRPDKRESTVDVDAIATFLASKGIAFSRWSCDAPLAEGCSDDDILAAYRAPLDAFMAAEGYNTCDVIAVDAETPNLPALRDKFLKEHTHDEDEVRFFVEGKGLFWFNHGEVFSLLLEAGDFVSVPAGYRHWFDLTAEPRLKAIRIFKSVEGWVPHYTESGIDSQYNPPYAEQEPSSHG